MAIKFRCPHCQQLLGISTTKAGTTVDCPACGRSVNVPTEGGVAKRTEPKQQPNRDAGLLNALQELSALGNQTNTDSGPPPLSKAVPRERKSPVLRSSTPEPGSSAGTDRDTMRIVPLANTYASQGTGPQQKDVRSALAKMAHFENAEPLILDEQLETDAVESSQAHGSAVSKSATESSPRDLNSALQELADVTHETSSATMRDGHANLESASKRSQLLPLMFALPAFAIGLLLGTFWKSHGPLNTSEPTAKAIKAIPAATIPAPNADERQINGVVSYVDDSGSSTADAGAIVLLLPTENTTRLRLDARPLREATDSRARQAIEAALSTLGGCVSQTDSSGKWTANIPVNTTFNIVVISRHRSRTESQPVPADTLTSLSNWFDTPLHIVGRLAVQQTIMPPASDSNPNPIPLQIEFARVQ
jgi:ribosomal protein S27E